MKKIYKISFFLSIFLFILFLVYSFYPVISYDKSFSSNINQSYYSFKWPGRIYIQDRNWEVITDKMYPNWYYKYMDINLESDFVKSLLEIEDKNYYDHFWVNFLSKIRAIKDNLSWKKISGWSTITEQYIKNKYFKTNKRTYLQKAREALLALYFNFSNTKNDLLYSYLSDIYLWNNIYGLWWAIEVYFSKDNLDELTREEIVILLSLLNNPSSESYEENYFRDYFEQTKKRLWFEFERTYFWKLPKKKNIDNFPFVTNRILSLNPFISDLTNYKSSIDSKLSYFSREILNQTLSELKDKNVTNWAIVAFNPKTMEVLVYEWSRDFYSLEIDWQVDVIKSKRQPWSTMKPFLYLLALKSGFMWDNLVLDLSNFYSSFVEGKSYISENYSLKEYWLIRLKKALWNSLNNSSVRLSFELWLDRVYKFYKEFWFRLDYDAIHYWYSLVLWNPSISLENLVLSYVNLIPDFETKTDRELRFEKSSIDDFSYSEIDPEKFLLYDILKNPDNRDISFWVNSILNTSIYQAVKTWTSSDFRDNLAVSYSPDLVVWVWVWNNDNSSMIWVTGITWAWYIWHQVVEESIKKWYIKNHDYKIPKDIEKSDYCLDKKCFRKEQVYVKKWIVYKSAIVDDFYSKDDIIEKLSDFEKKRLEELWVYIN